MIGCPPPSLPSLYLQQGDQVYIYKSAAHYTLIEGYPKSLKEELGIDGTVNASLLCADEDIVHFIQGKLIKGKMFRMLCLGFVLVVNACFHKMRKYNFCICTVSNPNCVNRPTQIDAVMLYQDYIKGSHCQR